MKTIRLVVALAALVCSGVEAQEAKRPPMRVVDVLMLGEGTVTGVVKRVGSRYFALSDGQQTVDVTSKEFMFDVLKEGDTVTVTGVINHGSIKPTDILRADGTLLPKRDVK